MTALSVQPPTWPLVSVLWLHWAQIQLLDFQQKCIFKLFFCLLSAQCFNYVREPKKWNEYDQTLWYLHDKTKNQLSTLKLRSCHEIPIKPSEKGYKILLIIYTIWPLSTLHNLDPWSFSCFISSFTGYVIIGEVVVLKIKKKILDRFHALHNLGQMQD